MLDLTNKTLVEQLDCSNEIIKSANRQINDLDLGIDVLEAQIKDLDKIRTTIAQSQLPWLRYRQDLIARLSQNPG